MSYYVYILRCGDNSLYTGIARDIERRVAEHNGERPGGARYTAGRRPVVVVHTEACASRSEAQAREWAIKQLSRAEKLRLFLH